MSFLNDLFGGANQAAADQTQGILQGLTAAGGNINQGNQQLTSNYTAGLQPFQQNYAQSQAGTQQMGNLLGLNGQAGSQNAQAALATMPGYQFQLGQGNNAINAAAAAGGTLNSGNQAMALQKYGQGLAGQNYGQYVSQLSPYMTEAQNSASGIGSMYGNLGNQLNANQNTLANLNMNAFTGIGNANASAALANQKMDMGLLGGLGSFLTSPSSSFGSSIGGSMLSGLGSLFTSSDERLKEDIAPVGSLYDGQKVYSYRYKGDSTPRVGLLAQEVEKVHPEAVKEFGGFKAVNYGKATEFASELGKFLRDAA